jgi:hypothetical protein
LGSRGLLCEKLEAAWSAMTFSAYSLFH